MEDNQAQSETPIVADQYAEKAAELSKQYNCKVTPFVFKDESGAEIVGYIKEPNRATKLRIIDKSYTGSPISSSSDVLDVYLVAEASDPRILSDDTYYLGACKVAYNLVQLAVDQYKKK